jgi:hypothetical protein
MDAGDCGLVHGQPFPCLAEPAGEQAHLLQPMPDGFGAVIQAFATGFRYPIDLGCDLAYEDLGVALVAQAKGRLKCETLEAGRAVCVPLVSNWCQ